MKRPTLRGVFKVLFHVYMAFVLLAAGVDLLLGMKNIGAFDGDTISGLLKFFVGLPGSMLMLSSDRSGWSRETFRVMLWGPILLNLLILGGPAFITNRSRLHVLLLAFEGALLFAMVDARAAFDCSPRMNSVVPARFWQETLSSLAFPVGPVRYGFECPGIPWPALLVIGLLFFAHLFYLIVLRSRAGAPQEVSQP